jgi:HK97 gp10 family phage protein|nr:MAG TPA: putative tail component [Caudoviricetes sp.]
MAVMMSDESGSFDVEHLEDFDVSGILEVRADNRREVADAIDQALAAALEEVGLAAEGFAKRLCPVDTGRLRNSITHVTRPGEKAVYIGTNVEYGPYVEYGTSRQEAQPFLRPAATGHGDTYRAIVEAHLRG